MPFVEKKAANPLCVLYFASILYLRFSDDNVKVTKLNFMV